MAIYLNTIGEKPLFDAFGTTKSLPRPSGHIEVDGHVVADTARCVNCGNHFIMVKGSGKLRGYCADCRGYLCGEPGCLPCKHGMKKMRDGS